MGEYRCESTGGRVQVRECRCECTGVRVQVGEYRWESKGVRAQVGECRCESVGEAGVQQWGYFINLTTRLGVMQ